MKEIIKQVKTKYAHIEGDVNAKVAAWLSDLRADLVLLQGEAAVLPHRAEVALDTVVAGIGHMAEDITKHPIDLATGQPRKAL